MRLKEVMERITAEGRDAKRKKKKETSCPYGMSKALTNIEIPLQIKARTAWMKGYNDG